MSSFASVSFVEIVFVIIQFILSDNGLLLLGILAGIFYLLTLITVRTFFIKNNKYLSDDQVLNELKLDNNSSFLLTSNIFKRNEVKNSSLIKSVDIEIFKKVKSNTALASTALFLATGVFVGQAKEEMKYVRTKLNIKDDGIEIKNPYSYHKFIDFSGFKLDKEDNNYLYYIVLSDKEMIHFRTKNEDLREVILDKINSTSGLTYEYV